MCACVRHGCYSFTAALLQPGGPRVMSISYGWQGDLAQLGCDQPIVDVIDANFVKLAAAGVSVIISSGDSGSGYTTRCTSRSYKKGTDVAEGRILRSLAAESSACCQAANDAKAEAFVWKPPAQAMLEEFEDRLVGSQELSVRKLEQASRITWKQVPYHVLLGSSSNTVLFPDRDVHILDGSIGLDGAPPRL